MFGWFKKNLSISSTKEDVSNFLSKNYKIKNNIKDNIINENITGETLKYLDDNDYTFLGIEPDVKAKIKNYLETKKNQFIEKPINITLNDNSNINEVKKFCQEYLSFKGKLNDDLDGKKILSLTDQEMKNIGLNLGQRKKLLKYIKHVEEINYNNDLKKFLNEKLNFTQQKIESLKLNGDDLYAFIREEIGKLSPNQKNKKKKLLKKLKEKYNKSKTNTNINSDINEETQTDINTSTNVDSNININTNENINTDNNDNNSRNNERVNQVESNLADKANNNKNNNNIKNGENNNKDNPKDNKEDKNKNKISKTVGKKDSKIYYTPLKNYKLQPLDGNSKYNLFFILIVNELNFNLSFLSIYSIDYKFFGFSNSYDYINYNFYFISEGRFSQNDENLRYLIVQVPIKKDIQRIFITYTINNIYGYKYYNTEIGINKINNYFYIDNLKYENTYYNSYPTLDINEIFAYFLNFFFDKEKNKEEFLQISLMKALINKVNYNYQIKLSPEIILKYFKYCLYFKLDLREIKSIQLIEKKNFKIPKEYYISIEDINNNILNENQKSEIIKLIVKIYSLYDIPYLIESKGNNKYSRAILDLINLKKLKFSDMTFKNEESIIQFQNRLLLISESKSEINYILKLSKGLTKCLMFIISNYQQIYTILKNKASFLKTNEDNYSLSLPKVGKDDTFEKINELLKKFFEKINKNDYFIIKIEKILNDLIEIYFTKSLNELCKLKEIVNICEKKGIILSNSETLYAKINQKGIDLIKHNKMTIEEIIQFLYSQNIYYYDEKYKDLRNPDIFEYISITDSNKNNEKNIQELKNKKIWELYKDSKGYLKKDFYNSFLKQIKNIKDLQYIFELFSIENISKDFNQMINEKLGEIKLTDLDKERNQEIIFEIYSNLLICNDKNKLDLKLYLKQDYDFTSKYLFYLLKNNKLKNIIIKLKKKIINYFLEQNKKGNVNEESLISFLLLSPNNDFCLDLLNQMENKILTEEEFYQKKESKNFILFKYFFEKCTDLIKNEEILNGKYCLESVKVKSKIEDDLSKSQVKFETMNNLIDYDTFYKKILIIYDKDEQKSKNIYDKIKNDLQSCNKLFLKFEKIKDFYNTFLKNTKQTIINSIKKALNQLKQKNLDEILKLDEKTIIENDGFNLEEAINESENLKYKDSLFFMAIYKEKYNIENLEKTDQEIFDSSKNEFLNSMKRIIQQNETKEPFFEINNVNEIINTIKDNDDNMEEEFNFISKEFESLGKESYIKNNLLGDLINFSKKDKVERLLQGLIYFIESCKTLFQFQETEFISKLKNQYKIINSKGVSGEEILESIKLLSELNYNIDHETTLMKFYEIFLGKEESIEFIKKIKDANLEIRNLNEFIDENENSQLQTTDIDNLLDIYTFFEKLFNNKSINTDESFHKIFKASFELEKDIIIKLKGYLSSYGEIIQLFQLYDENPEMTTQKINKILMSSILEIYKEEKKDCFMFKIKYLNQKEKEIEIDINQIEELKNKILISCTNSNLLKEEGKNDKINKEQLTNQFVTLIDNINQLINTLDNLLKTGYPHISNLTLKIENSFAFDSNNKEKDLHKIIDEYKEINKNYKKLVKKGYENYAFLRLFYGKQFIQLYEKVKNNNADISHLVNSMTFNKIKNFNVTYQYDNNINNIENINKFLENLFSINNITLDDIYNKNKILDNWSLEPGLYRIIKTENDLELSVNISNIYINLTGNAPIIYTLLICNDETNNEKIKSFLYRAIFCDSPILFLITNIECLELSIKQNLIKTLNVLYKSKNKIKSYILFLYKKVDSGLERDIEKLIPEKNILNNFLKKPEKSISLFNETESYSSKFAGYGKTTEIKYKVKEKNGKYYYLPLGGVFTRNYVISNLENLNLELNEGKNIFIHLDLSETDNDDLMNELLFKLLILRFIDSNEKLFYLGNDVNIIIEIPNGFIDFKEKYKLLSLFKNIHIDKLCPLRLEENAVIVLESPISIVAETLLLYEIGQIGTTNIDLYKPIEILPNECECIINRHFKVENQNYYQKINFIKILSVQFKKFCENIYFNYDIASQDGKGDIILNARKLVIKNFIILTEVFTRSPYDSVLLKQIKSLKLFDKNKENEIREDAIVSLANEMKEIFSFELIKPSLVFFNRDGHSLSIITNIKNKNLQEYQDLYKLWNSQNPNPDINIDLIDYQNLKHEEFIKEIKALFSLDLMCEEEIKFLCEGCGNYIFVSDNYIKMVRILLNIEAKIPVILMGETGVGKTKLLEILATLYGKGEAKWKILQIHAGTNDKKIVDFIDKITQEAKESNKENELTWVFLDEINTCNSLGLITEIMCNHTYLGKKISDNFIFIAACNPYRLLTKKMRESGLIYYNMKENNKLNNLVYTVNPLPHSLLNFVFDFGSLKKEDEEKYISNTILEKISNFQLTHLIDDINEDELKEITNKIIKSIVTCHEFIRKKYDKSSVSMREIRRFGLFFEFFMKHFKNLSISYKKMQCSLNMTLYLCYYLRLNDKKDRQELAEKLKEFFQNHNFLSIPEGQVKEITSKMHIEKNKGIALNRALRENLFTIFVCIINKVPLIIVGKPGTSKSLSFQIVYNTMKGKYSENEFFKDKGKLYRYYYQGSETSTAEGIEQVYDKAMRAQKKNKNNDIITLVFFDEMGLAERSSNNPLKVIHYLLEKDQEESVPFLGISNWKLDASKINRALNLSITDYDIEDLEETALSIAEALNSKLSSDYKEFFENLARTYNNYIISNRNSTQENRDFHGNRDFYNLIKNAMRELIEKKNTFNKNFEKIEEKILIRIGIDSLERNFGGLEDSIITIKKIFREVHGFDESFYLGKNDSILENIKKNLLDSNSRYLMIISDGNDGSDIIKYLINSIGKNYIELVGSKYKKDIKSGKYSEEILNKIKYIMETDSILILRDLDMIYASLYDLFNQNFTCMGDKKFARIAFEYSKISSEVNKDFHVIIIVNNNKIQELKLDPPFLNRFEKHLINFRMLLKEKDIEIARKVSEYIMIISSYNNNENLKLDLGKLLINCEQHDIEGLIFKIKNENQIPKGIEGVKYEQIIIGKIFNKIAPTFCQDIIASILSSNYDSKYHLMNEIIIKTYKNCSFINFELFFEKLDKNKVIIYTFSKVTENIFVEGKNIKNKFGTFNKSSVKTEMIESIKSENDLISLLKEFFNLNNKNLLILRFSENDLHKVNSVNYVINSFEKDIKNKKNKLIIFIIHKQRHKKSQENKKINSDLISFINDEYYQIFIDNLNGDKNLEFCKLISNESDSLTQDFIKAINGQFVDKKIYNILNYLKFEILYQTKDFNSENCISIIAKKIIENKNLKELILKNIEKQGKSIKGIIKEVFISEINEVFDVDFIEVIYSKLNANFYMYLLNIIYYILNRNILIPILNDQSLDMLLKINYFKNLIDSEFANIKFNFVPQLKLEINANMISIYNGLSLPLSKFYLDKIINYVNEQICPRYIINEELMRKSHIKEEEISIFYDELERLENNIKVEINKDDFFQNIENNNNLKSMLLEDYLKYFIIKFLEKNEIDLKYNESVYKFLIIIIKAKLGESNSINYNFKNTFEEFIKIILFTQVYKNDIKNLFNIFIDVKKYCNNIEERICNILNEYIIKYEISDRNKEYTKEVNINFFNIIESLSRAILLYSVELIKIDKNKFHEYFSIFTLIEANLQKFNNKFNLYSKELGNLTTIIKVHESYKNNNEQFINNYENIINNLLKQSILLYNNDYNNCYNNILNLNKIFDETFVQKGKEYSDLLFFIFRLQYKLISDDEVKIKLIESFFKNPLLIRKSKIFLSETLKDMKPEIFNENSLTINKNILINNFMNLEDNQKLLKYKTLINQYNDINSDEFNELLLFTFENQCQSYFMSILSNNKNEYTMKTCEELLSNISFEYLKKAIKYIYNYNNNNYKNDSCDIDNLFNNSNNNNNINIQNANSDNINDNFSIFNNENDGNNANGNNEINIDYNNNNIDDNNNNNISSNENTLITNSNPSNNNDIEHNSNINENNNTNNNNSNINNNNINENNDNNENNIDSNTNINIENNESNNDNANNTNDNNVNNNENENNNNMNDNNSISNTDNNNAIICNNNNDLNNININDNNNTSNNNDNINNNNINANDNNNGNANDINSNNNINNNNENANDINNSINNNNENENDNINNANNNNNENDINNNNNVYDININDNNNNTNNNISNVNDINTNDIINNTINNNNDNINNININENNNVNAVNNINDNNNNINLNNNHNNENNNNNINSNNNINNNTDSVNGNNNTTNNNNDATNDINMNDNNNANSNEQNGNDNNNNINENPNSNENNTINNNIIINNNNGNNNENDDNNENGSDDNGNGNDDNDDDDNEDNNDINNNNAINNNINNNDININNLNVINVNDIINNNPKNNLLKLYAIAYIKTYYNYYVEINYDHFDKYNFDQINILLNLKKEYNKYIRKIIIIYILRLYSKKFRNFEEFMNFNFDSRNFPIYKELSDELSKESYEELIFNESFITYKCLENYTKIFNKIIFFIQHENNDIELNIDEINKNFDSFYCVLVNKMISKIYGNNKNIIIDKMKIIYNITNERINLGNEGKIIYQYLLNNELFENNIINRISDQPLIKEEFEILLYSLRFILNIQMNHNKCFYNDILKGNTKQFINDNYIPGSFPIINEFVKSYNTLNEKFKQIEEAGYYICKDCGYLYEVHGSTYPITQENCPNGHQIGGSDNICCKMDIRVFRDISELNKYTENDINNYSSSFISKTLEEFKRDYVDQHLLEITKGIMKNYSINDFVKNESYRNLNIITFRLLNFVLYSYLLSAYLLNNLNEEEIKPLLIENLSPNTLFGVIKKAWELLDYSLKEIGIENAQIFINMIFDKIIEYMNSLDSVDTLEKLESFEKSIDNYILQIIADFDKINRMNNDYYNLQEEILNYKPQSIKEIIQSNFEPTIYPQSIFPNIQYFYTSNILDFNSFVSKFNSCSDNIRKYALINLLINKENNLTKNAICLKCLNNINKFANLLLNIYSYKISRDDAKIRKLTDELQFIMNNYNEIYNSSINDKNAFINKYINPFIQSWNQIKDKLLEYNGRIIGDRPLEISINNPVSNFLVDDGDKYGGLFLASAYENMIEWQNQFIDVIISKNNRSGILNNYIYQLEKEINIQDATEDEIVNINDNTYDTLYDLILSSSMRNIFEDKNDKINYRNYNDIIYNYDLIEEELGKIILPGLKRFKKGKIKFITFLYEGFRGGNSTILVEYNNKYKKRELTEKERNCIDVLKANKNNRVYNDIFSSLQILMNEVIKENYDQNYLLYDIIKKLPKYIILNEDIIKLMDDNYNDKNSFTINSLVSFFEYFEDLCWNQIKKYIPSKYQLEINESTKQYILNYFNSINQTKKINKKNFTSALRKLISRSIAGSRQDIDMKYDLKLKMYIKREDLWNFNLVNNKSFHDEIDAIFKYEILVGHCWKLYNLLEGENNTLEEMLQRQRNLTNNNNINNNGNAQNNDNVINTNSNSGHNQEETDDSNEENEEESSNEEEES